MDLSGTGCRERDARLGELDAPVAQPTEPPLELPTWQWVVLAVHEEDKTPTVRILLGVIEEQAQRLTEQARHLTEQAKRIVALEAEIARLKGDKQKPRSNSKPSGLNKPPGQAPSADGKRPGSKKRSKTKDLTIHKEIPVPPKDLPPDSALLRRDSFVVQDLVIEVCNTRYLLETWQTPTGEERRGELPAGIRGHFGCGLIGFVLQQHYAAHVPQPRILEALRDYGIDISSGQINRIVTENHAAFHAEKDALLPTGLQVSTYVNVDDSGAPHQGRYGSCLCISNEFFASFHSSATKERSKFLDVLRCGHSDYVLDDVAWSYLEKQGLPTKVLRPLQDHAERTFADTAAWNRHLDSLGIDSDKHRQTVTEAALLGSVVAHGVSANLGIVSDGAGQYDLFVHGLCWIHQERNLAKLVPCGNAQCQALEEVLTAVWQLYADLKAYRAAPSPTQVEVLSAGFDAIVGRTTCFPELNAALARMAGNKADLLRVLERPDMPLHTNTVERDFRDWATKRKISAGTRGELGKRCRDTFMSLKATCKKLGIRFWAYLQDRLLGAGKIPCLPELVRQKAAASATT
jgi:hypothetical protein